MPAASPMDVEWTEPVEAPITTPTKIASIAISPFSTPSTSANSLFIAQPFRGARWYAKGDMVEEPLRRLPSPQSDELRVVYAALLVDGPADPRTVASQNRP